jgi:hypothetical protein
VVKPGRNGFGGIISVENVHEVEALPADKSAVCQLDVDPDLIRGEKFDFRFYVLISSLDLLTFFIHKEGIARFCTEVSRPSTRSNKDRRFVRLANPHINIENGGTNPADFPRKASEVLALLATHDSSRTLWNRICDATRAPHRGSPKPADLPAKRFTAPPIKPAPRADLPPPPTVSTKHSALLIRQGDSVQDALVVGSITNY